MNTLSKILIGILSLVGISTAPFTQTKTTLVDNQTVLRTSLGTAIGPFTDSFSTSYTLEETGAATESTSSQWWLNSGGYFYSDGVGNGMTVQGSLQTNDPWRVLYARDNPVDTDNGYHPQNIFRLVTQGQWQNPIQQAYFTITAQNLSASSERDAWSGILLFNRYQDGNTLYYTGLRVDGTAIIKSKKNGTYTTLAQVPVYSGVYNRTTNPTLLPQNSPIGLRSMVSTNPDNTVSIKLYVDKNNSGTWTLAASAIDAVNPILNTGHAGIRTDFMDVKIANYSIDEIPAPDTTPPTTPTLSLLSKTDTQIRLTWTPSVDAGGVDGYMIYRDGKFIDSTRTATSYTASGLTPETTYSFTVVARDIAGNLSTQSNILTTTTNQMVQSVPPPVISTVTIGSITQNSATISWITNVPTSSKVEYGTTTNYGTNSLPTTLLTTNHSVMLSGLVAGTPYHARAIVTDAQGNTTMSQDIVFTTTPSLQSTGGDTTPPTTPTLSLLGKSNTKVQLTWTRATDNVGVVGYTVYMNGSRVDSTRTATNITISNLSQNTRYTFSIKARDAAGNLSSESNLVTVTTNRR